MGFQPFCWVQTCYTHLFSTGLFFIHFISSQIILVPFQFIPLSTGYSARFPRPGGCSWSGRALVTLQLGIYYSQPGRPVRSLSIIFEYQFSGTGLHDPSVLPLLKSFTIGALAKHAKWTHLYTKEIYLNFSRIWHIHQLCPGPGCVTLYILDQLHVYGIMHVPYLIRNAMV